MDQERFGHIINQAAVLQPAAAGVSAMQENTRPSLTVHGVVVALVLRIACANVANLMIAQGAAKEHIGGFWVLEVANLDEALAWGRKAVIACRAPVEVRPFGTPTKATERQ
jgi:hypothetical protein